MKVIKQSARIIGGLPPMEHIEKIGRICYKSEDKIADGSAGKFIKMLYKNVHHAMLEHYRFIMKVSPVIYNAISDVRHDYIEMTAYDNRYIISFSARALINLVEDSDCDTRDIFPQQQFITDYLETPHQFLPMRMVIAGIRDELIGHIIKAYDCYELFGWDRNSSIMVTTGVEFIPNNINEMNTDEWLHHGWRSVVFTTDRGVTHELVRHRRASFAQESTRYCNYSNDKFGNEITVIDQGFDGHSERCWRESVACAESIYFDLLDHGVKPQMARSVLPTCTKADIVVTANMMEWKHIFELRYYGATGAPHPMMKDLMSKIVDNEEMRYEMV